MVERLLLHKSLLNHHLLLLLLLLLQPLHFLGDKIIVFELALLFFSPGNEIETVLCILGFESVFLVSEKKKK